MAASADEVFPARALLRADTRSAAACREAQHSDHCEQGRARLGDGSEQHWAKFQAVKKEKAGGFHKIPTEGSTVSCLSGCANC